MAVVLTLFAAAFLLRYAFRGLIPGVPFITFFPVVLAATLVAGWPAGAFVTGLSAVAAAFFFTGHDWSVGSLWPDGPISIALYLLTCGILIWIAEELFRGLEALAKERDRSAALFSELQHRVANTLQFASSALRLEAKRLGRDSLPGQSLEAVSERLAQWGGLHRLLYSPEMAVTPVAEIVNRLCRELILSAARTDVTLRVSAPQHLFLPTEHLLPLSLLIAELVTNAIKHAFPSGRPGEIDVMIEADTHGLVLKITDNGRGMQQTSPSSSSGGLGSDIVGSLARQIGGHVTVQSDGHGTQVVVTVPRSR